MKRRQTKFDAYAVGELVKHYRPTGGDLRPASFSETNTLKEGTTMTTKTSKRKKVARDAPAKLYEVILHRDRTMKRAERVKARVYAADQADAQAWARTVAAEPDAKWWRYDQTLQWDEVNTKPRDNGRFVAATDNDDVRVVSVTVVRGKNGKPVTWSE